jgi:hypothetical protein
MGGISRFDGVSWRLFLEIRLYFDIKFNFYFVKSSSRAFYPAVRFMTYDEPILVKNPLKGGCGITESLHIAGNGQKG